MTTTTDTGFVLWLTGLSGAGKSTVAAKLAPALAERGHRVELLDGDEVRTNLCQGLGFSREDRDRVRAAVDNFVEVYVAAPVSTCAERDVKGLYAKALAGEIKNFTGVSDPYEPPVNPEIELHTEAESVDESVHQVIAWLEANQLTAPSDR